MSIVKKYPTERPNQKKSIFVMRKMTEDEIYESGSIHKNMNICHLASVDGEGIRFNGKKYSIDSLVCFFYMDEFVSALGNVWPTFERAESITNQAKQ